MSRISGASSSIFSVMTGTPWALVTTPPESDTQRVVAPSKQPSISTGPIASIVSNPGKSTTVTTGPFGRWSSLVSFLGEGAVGFSAASAA